MTAAPFALGLLQAPSTGAELLIAFCLRLALGLVAALLILPTAEVAPRFYRTQFLIALGLCAAASVVLVNLLRDGSWGGGLLTPALAMSLAVLGAYAGSIVYTLERAPGGRLCILLTLLALVVAGGYFDFRTGWLDRLTSASLLGAAMSSMLMGHSYLIAPGMSMTPLRRLLVALFLAVGVRCALEGWWQAVGGRPLDSATESSRFAAILMLVRLGVGIVGVAFLGWLAWRCTAIRSTQSATGILYVVVILSFFGELLSLLLHTGYLLNTQVALP